MRVSRSGWEKSFEKGKMRVGAGDSVVIAEIRSHVLAMGYDAT